MEWHRSRMRNVVFLADYFQHQPQRLVEAVLKEYDQVPRCPSLLTQTDGIGYTDRPVALLLAHERNDRRSGPNVVLNSRSGRFLFQAMALAGLDPRSLFIVNALQVSKCQHRKVLIADEVWEAVRPVVTVALGEEAARLKPLKVDAVIPHPAWANRFQHGRMGRYGEVLKQAIELGKSCTGKEF